MTSSLNNNPDHLYVLCLDVRYGATAFATAVEFRHFPPCNKQLSDHYTITPVLWKGQAWYVVKTPVEFTKTAVEIARELGMKLVGGVPTMLSNGGEKREYFPLRDGPNVYTLENRERPGLHCVPWISESQLKIDIIREAQKHWNADFSPSIQAELDRGVQSQPNHVLWKLNTENKNDKKNSR